MPWADLDRVGRFTITVTPGDAVVAIGDDVMIAATVQSRFAAGDSPRAAQAWLEWSADGDSTISRFEMPAGDAAARPDASTSSESPPHAGSFALTLPRIAGSMGYRVASGGVISRRYRITAVEPPAIAALAARIEPPAYTKLPAYLARDPRRIEALEGSRVTLEITANKPVRSIDLEWPAEKDKPAEQLAAELTSEGGVGAVTAVARDSGPYAVSLRDGHGIASRSQGQSLLVVRPDAPPTVVLGGTDGVKEASPADSLTVAVAVRDDIAVDSVELHYAIGQRRVGLDRGRDRAIGRTAGRHRLAPRPGRGRSATSAAGTRAG